MIFSRTSVSLRSADEPADISCCAFNTRTFDCEFNHDAFRIKPGTKKSEKNCKGEPDLDQKKPDTKAGTPGSTNEDVHSILAEDKRFVECWQECHYESGRCDFCDIPIFDKDPEADQGAEEIKTTSFLEHHHAAFLEVRHRILNTQKPISRLWKGVQKMVTGKGEDSGENFIRDKDWDKRVNEKGKKFGGKYLKGYCCRHGYFDKWDPAKHGGAEWKFVPPSASGKDSRWRTAFDKVRSGHFDKLTSKWNDVLRSGPSHEGKWERANVYEPFKAGCGSEPGKADFGGEGKHVCIHPDHWAWSQAQAQMTPDAIAEGAQTKEDGMARPTADMVDAKHVNVMQNTEERVQEGDDRFLLKKVKAGALKKYLVDNTPIMGSQNPEQWAQSFWAVLKKTLKLGDEVDEENDITVNRPQLGKILDGLRTPKNFGAKISVDAVWDAADSPLEV